MKVGYVDADPVKRYRHQDYSAEEADAKLVVEIAVVDGKRFGLPLPLLPHRSLTADMDLVGSLAGKVTVVDRRQLVSYGVAGLVMMMV